MTLEPFTYIKSSACHPRSYVRNEHRIFQDWWWRWYCPFAPLCVLNFITLICITQQGPCPQSERSCNCHVCRRLTAIPLTALVVCGGVVVVVVHAHACLCASDCMDDAVWYGGMYFSSQAEAATFLICCNGGPGSQQQEWHMLGIY